MFLFFLDHGASAGNETGTSLDLRSLHSACKDGHLEIVRKLLSNGVCINDENLCTPLQYACEFGHKEIAEILLCNGATVDDKDAVGKQAIHKASEKGQFQAVGSLIDCGASELRRCGLGRALLYACKGGHTDVVELLLLKGANVDFSYDVRCTPLHLACESGNSEIVDVLLSYGSKVNQGDSKGRQPLHIACHRGLIGIAQALLARGACTFHDDCYGENPLSIACKHGNVELLRLLLTNTAAFPTIAPYLVHPLRQACHHNHIQIVKDLLAHCAKIDDFSVVNLPLEEVRSEEVARILILHGADVNATTRYGGTSLQSCWSDIVPVLLDYGAGSGRPCCQCKSPCQKTELMCFYEKRKENVDIFDNFFAHKKTAREAVFESFFIKKNTARLANAEEKAKEPGDWSEQKRSAFRAECEAEVERMRNQTINNTSATYHDLLTRNLSALRYQPIVGNFDPEECVDIFTIYGDMTISSYLQLRRFFLINQSAAFFSLTVPELPPECAENVVVHLSEKDIENLLKFTM